MEFLKNLNEARLFPEGRYSLRFYNGKDISNLMFLHMMGIQILKYENNDSAKYYLRGISTWNFNYWISARNEVYACLHLISGKYNQDTLEFLADYKKSKEFLKYVKFNNFDFRKYVRLLYANAPDDGFERRYFIQLQSDLRITDSIMSNIRGYVAMWPTVDLTMQKIVLGRLLQLMRVLARRSELLPLLEEVARKMNVKPHTLSPILTQDSPKLQNTPVKEEFFPFLKQLS